jgi:hypothetical protein
MMGSESLELDESVPGKLSCYFPPVTMKRYNQIVGFSGTLQASGLTIVSSYLDRPQSISIPTLKS